MRLFRSMCVCRARLAACPPSSDTRGRAGGLSHEFIRLWTLAGAEPSAPSAMTIKMEQCARRQWRRIPHVPSTGPKSLFRQVVGICYEVIDPKADGELNDPVRQIRSFVDSRKRTSDADGQKVPKESDLPS